MIVSQQQSVPNRTTIYRKDYHVSAYLITSIELEFELDADKTIVTAISQVVKKSSIPQESLILYGENLTLLLLEINGQLWEDYQVTAKQLIIHNAPQHFTLKIINQLSPIENTAFEGLYVSGEILCTQCEAEGFRHITYYLDRPDVLACFNTKIIADKQRYPYLLSNGNRIDSGDLADGRHWVLWQDPFPKPSYLFALVAGKFDLLQDTFKTKSGREIKLELYVDCGQLGRASWAMQCLKEAMRWDEQRFNLEYDLDIYMIVAVDFFNMGAMENKGLNIFNSKFVLADTATATDRDYLNIESVIGHEYFHNWTGNRVTCRDWFQLSLKEGLTVFRDQEFSADLGSRAVTRIDAIKLLRSAQFAEDASPMAHPIRPEQVIEINNFYTLTVYEKGAEVIRMIHTLLGEKNFQKGMQNYLTRHDGTAVTCEDFVKAMEDASGYSLEQFRYWYSQSGTPELTIIDKYIPEHQEYHLEIKQFTPPTLMQSDKSPLHIPLNIDLYDQQGTKIPLIMNRQEIQSVLNLTQTTQKIVFEDVPSTPIPIFLKGYSAPVKLKYEYSDKQLVFLMQYAQDDFSRWDAAQMLLTKYIKLNVERLQQQQATLLPILVIDAFRAVLLDTKIDLALAAQILTLPTEQEIAEFFDVIDPDAIVQVRHEIKQFFADEMADELLAVYRAHHSETYCFDQPAVAKRSLRNVCLNYIAYINARELADKIVNKQYQITDNMTDSLAALTAAVESQLPCCSVLMEDFEQRWYQDGLVMDKWFALQARRPSNQALSVVQQLLQHRSFSLANPNRVRALIGTFCVSNLAAFHALDGSGYHFLAEVLSALNQSNPQVAARLIDPLIKLKRYDNKRQQLIRNTLEKLQQLNNLSGDLYEKITLALA